MVGFVRQVRGLGHFRYRDCGISAKEARVSPPNSSDEKAPCNEFFDLAALRFFKTSFVLQCVIEARKAAAGLKASDRVRSIVLLEPAAAKTRANDLPPAKNVAASWFSLSWFALPFLGNSRRRSSACAYRILDCRE